MPTTRAFVALLAAVVAGFTLTEHVRAQEPSLPASNNGLAITAAVVVPVLGTRRRRNCVPLRSVSTGYQNRARPANNIAGWTEAQKQAAITRCPRSSR
jgi:hypothetical protein